MCSFVATSLAALALAQTLPAEAGLLSEETSAKMPTTALTNSAKAKPLSPTITLVAPNTPPISYILQNLTLVGSRMSALEALQGKVIRPDRARKDLELLNDALMALDLPKAKLRSEAMMMNQNAPLRRKNKILSCLCAGSAALIFLGSKMTLGNGDTQQPATGKNKIIRVVRAVSLIATIASGAAAVCFASRYFDAASNFDPAISLGAIAGALVAGKLASKLPFVARCSK
jgi:hypothetical protein